MQGTLRAIENNLLVDREFLLRYETDNAADGLPSGEGAFLACSFWLVDNYILQGRVTEARQLFNRLLSHCNDVGLLSEQFDPVTGRMLGNFPQAFTHVGLINSALNLNRPWVAAPKSAQKHEWPAPTGNCGNLGQAAEIEWEIRPVQSEPGISAPLYHKLHFQRISPVAAFVRRACY